MENSKNEKELIEITPIKGNLSLVNGEILVELKVPVGSENYKPFAGDAYMIDGEYKALVFRYYDTTMPANPDYRYPKVCMEVGFKIENFYKWEPESTVRVMCLNESSSTEFRQLDDYFSLRLSTFKYRKEVKEEEYIRLNRSWNAQNKNNRVYPEFKITDLIDAKEQPRRTKDDGILILR